LRPPAAVVEERHVARLDLDQIVHQDHLQCLAEVDRLGEVAVYQERHQRHLEAVLGDALLAPAGEPAVAQLGLQALGEREEVEYSPVLGHEVALLAQPRQGFDRDWL
jgi:hypothetical protein